MLTCFVIQPFDGGAFDRRYEDVLVPAILAAGFEPYRVDQDPATRVLIDDIERGIARAAACVADITIDNPNVWYELGYAMALGKEVVLIRAKDAPSRFPFDVQHRHIITYSTEAPSDFETLKKQITERLEARIDKARQIAEALAQPIIEAEGLKQHEFAALVCIMQNCLHPDDVVVAYRIKEDMNTQGFTDIAVSIALRSLLQGGKVALADCVDYEARESYQGYKLTDSGVEWLVRNQQNVVLRREPKQEERDPIDDISF